MEPRVFISSTYYDLKHVRERLGRFVESYGFKPILFEEGDVGYILRKTLDLSCYQEMSACDMAILIVGGRYGSPASEEKQEDAKEVYKEYISVTCQEFKTAVESHIPVYVFVVSSVYEQYRVYQKNKRAFDERKIDIDFPDVDNIDVLRFISEIHAVPGLPIEQFSKIADIENYLRKQWAALFQKYLTQLKEAPTINALNAPIDSILSKLECMNKKLELLDKQVESVIYRTDSPVVYVQPTIESINDECELQDIAITIADAFDFIILDRSKFNPTEYIRFFIEQLIEAGNLEILEYPFTNNPLDWEEFYSLFRSECAELIAVKAHLEYLPDFINKVKKHKEKLIEILLQPQYLEDMKLKICSDA